MSVFAVLLAPLLIGPSFTAENPLKGAAVAPSAPAVARDRTFSSPEADKSESKSFIKIEDTSLEAGLEYPLSFGLNGKYHINDSFYARIGTGFTPKILLGAFQRTAPSLGYLNRKEAQLIGDVIRSSLLGAYRFGWLPYTKKSGGPYMELGVFGMAFGRGGETSGGAINEVLGADLNEAGKNLYSVRSDLFGAAFYAGYQIPIEKRIRLNIEAGVLKILYAEVKQYKKGSSAEPLPKKYHKELESFLVRKGWIFPTISAWIGFSF